MFLLSIIYCETLCNATECDNGSRGDSSLHEICHAKDADMPIVEFPADSNEDQVSNSRVQLDKPCPTDSEDLSEQL